MTAVEPVGRRPRRLTASRRIGVYAFLVSAALFFLLPLWIMLVTSLKTMDEIRLGNILAWPERPHASSPGSTAWSEACTGLDCDGISVGFWNSVRILIPSVILSIAGRRGQRLRPVVLAGARRQLAVRASCSPAPSSPTRSSSIPLVRLFSQAGIYNSLPGIVLVHIIFGLPMMTLLFRNYYASLPIELFKAARVDGGGFWTIFLRVMLPMSTPILIVATHPAGHRHLERLHPRPDLRRPREPADDRAAQQHRQLDPGRARLQCRHGGDHADRRWSRSSSTSSPGAGSCAASPPAR